MKKVRKMKLQVLFPFSFAILFNLTLLNALIFHLIFSYLFLYLLNKPKKKKQNINLTIVLYSGSWVHPGEYASSGTFEFIIIHYVEFY